MKAATTGVTAKLFLGLPLTPDTKMQLEQSPEWRQRQQEEKLAPWKLNIVHFQSKEYVGVHVEDSITMNELKMTVLFCLDRFKLYFPSVHIDAHKLVFFPQIFIS